MRIQHNIPAMSAYRNYTSNTSALAKNLEKLSSGYKINRAGDDAAGLAISEKMRAQITGLATAQKNAKDGISLIQTAEGALTEVHDMLNRMYELANQSANGTYDDAVDRDNLQKEFDALRTEIDRISKASNFNGINLLNGDQKQGADISQMTGIDIAALSTTGVPGSGTILHANETAAAKSKFTIELGNLSFENGATQKLNIDLGGGGDGTGAGLTLELEGDGNGKLDAAGIQAALVAKYGSGGASETDVKINGQDFVLTGSGSTITLEQKDTPTNANEVVEPSMSVSISATDTAQGGAAAGTKGVYSFSIGTAFVNGESLTIKGKEIKFDTSGDPGTVNVGTVTSAADQMNAIKNLLNADSSFGFDVTVDNDSTPTELIFTQKTASTTNTIANGDIIASAGAATGTVGTIQQAANNAIVNATPNAYSVKIETALVAGESLTIGGQTLTFGAGDTFDIDTSAATTAADQATAVADFFNDPTNNVASAWKVEVDPSDLSGQTLKFTEKVALNNTTAPTAKVTDTATGKAYITADATDMVAGKYTLNIDAVFAANESIEIGDATIDFYSGSIGGYGGGNVGIDIDGLDKDGIAAAIVAAMSSGNAAQAPTGYTVAAGTDPNTVVFTQSAIDANDPLTATVDSGTTVVNTGKLTGNAATVTPSPSGYAPGTPGVWELDITDAFANGDKITIGNQEIVFSTNGGSDIDASNGSFDEATEQAAAIAAKLQASNAFAGFTVANSGAKITFTQNVASDNPADAFDTTTAVTTGTVATGATANFNEDVTAVDPTSADDLITGDWNAATTVITQGTEQKNGRLASTTINLTNDMVKDGQSINIGDKTYTFKIGKDSTTTAAAGDTLVDLSRYEADAADLLERAAEALSNATADNGIFTSSGYDKTKVTFLEKEGQNKADLSNMDKIKSQFSYGKKVIATGLNLQIGEDSESYNRLTVSINKMDCESLGIDATKINIDSQAGAQNAVDSIKAAINSVSSTRGDLGAMQNRLEHTINNLSVMQENIQDAESTIRDVDVAQEMMEYTKNNILVQSAQAMLAQANQMPQGVLQLLQ